MTCSSICPGPCGSTITRSCFSKPTRCASLHFSPTCIRAALADSGCVQFTLRYVNKGKIDQIVSIDSIYDKLRSKGKGIEGEIIQVFRMLDEDGSGRVSLDDLVNVLRKFNFDLDEDELIALLARWDQAKDGFIDYEDLVGTVYG